MKNKKTPSRNTKEYKSWRDKVYKRDNYTCRHCGAKGGELEAHHLCSFTDNKDLRYVVENGVTLCKKCHAKFHDIYGKGGNTADQYIEYNATVDKKRGRPSKYDESQIKTVPDMIIEDLEWGFSVKTACKHVGIGTTTYYEWIAKKPDFAARVNTAHRNCHRFVVGKLFDNIARADQRAIEFFLKTRVDDYRPEIQDEGEREDDNHEMEYQTVTKGEVEQLKSKDKDEDEVHSETSTTSD